MLATLALAVLLVVPQGTSAAAAKPDAPDRLAHPVVIGASFSAGFGAGRSFAEAFAASLRKPEAKVLDLGDVLFFTSPPALGKQQVEAALAGEPTLVLAVDFLFWFGYGSLDAEGGPIESEDERLVLLERGLALLEEFECPLVVADFPDMSAAVGGMLAPAQMPEKATLPRLSQRVRAWAAQRPNTLVLPLAELVAKLGSKDELHIGRQVFPPGTRLLQSDELHPTSQGLVAIAQLVCDDLVQQGLAREADFEFDLAKVRERLRAVPVGAGR